MRGLRPERRVPRATERGKPLIPELTVPMLKRWKATTEQLAPSTSRHLEEGLCPASPFSVRKQKPQGAPPVSSYLYAPCVKGLARSHRLIK